MTLNEYMSNPMGKGTSIGLSEIKNNLDLEYTELKSGMTLTIYRIAEETLFYLVTVPSRHAKNLSYQVLFQFDIHMVPDEFKDVRQLTFSCFSNCPSFSYTYAKVFDEKGMLCTWLKTKYDKKVFKSEPETRNSQKLISYERSMYLAAKFISNSGKSKIEYAKVIGLPVKNHSMIASKINEQQYIEDKYNAATKEPEKKKVFSANKPKLQNKHTNSSTTGTTNYTKSTSKISSTKKTKTTNKF